MCICSVTIHFKFPDGTRKTAKANVGDNLLDAVLSNNLDIDGYGMFVFFLSSEYGQILAS